MFQARALAKANARKAGSRQDAQEQADEYFSPDTVAVKYN